jgi:hypothetical protein
MEKPAAPRWVLRAHQAAQPRTVLLALLTAAAAIAGCARPFAPDESARAAPSPTAPAPLLTAPAAAPAPSTTAMAAAPDPFTSTVRPILARTCAPCHEPNGQMYGKLPFDKPEVIASHSSGVLRRLKGDDKEVLERWIAGQAAAPTETRHANPPPPPSSL